MLTFNSLGILGRIGDRVYQRTQKGHGNVVGDETRTLQNRRYVPHHIGNSTAQAVNRSKFAAATAAWYALTDEEKNALRKEAERRQVSVWNTHISKFMKGG